VKKLNFSIIAFVAFLAIFILNTKKVVSCHPNAIQGLSNCEDDANCGPNGSNNVGSINGNNQGYCEATFENSCHDVIPVGVADYFTLCYLKKGVLTPTATQCGRLNAPCCPAPDFCAQGLGPVSVGINSCYCQNPANPIPTKSPDPIGSITINGINVTCNEGKGIRTALGCIPANNLNVFVGWFLRSAIFIASGVGFLLLIFGAFLVLTSAGNPEKVQAGKELITAAISGIAFIILSLFILNLVGVQILRLPGFGK